MAQVIVRNLDDGVVERLKRRAARQHISLEQSLRDILTEAAKPGGEDLWDEMARLRASIGHVAGDSTDLIREDRDNDEPYR